MMKGIDRKMWRFKLHFFLFIGGIAAVFPYVPHYVNKNIGISTTALAVILMTQQFLFVITKPMIGYLADYFNRLKAIICILAVIQGLCFALILFIPPVKRFSCHSNDTCYMQHDCAKILNRTQEYTSCLQDMQHDCVKALNRTQEYKSCLQDMQHDCVKDLNKTQEYTSCLQDIQYDCVKALTTSCLQDDVASEFVSYQFWTFALIHTLGMVSNNAVFTLSDTACCESVVKAGADFGRQRLWGAIGWGLLAPLGGLLNDYTESYVSSWIFMEICLCFSIWNISKLELQKPHFSKNIVKDVGTVLKSREFLVFELGLLMNGIGAAMIWCYLVLFLISIGASKLLCGLSLTVQSFLGTLPLMYFSGSIIKRMGHLNVCSLALIMYTVRFLWYSYLYNPWLVLLVELLHGFTYGLLYADIASFGKESAMPGTEATTQSVLFSTHEGLGGGIGCVLGGLGLDLIGGHQTFFICGLFTGLGFILHQLGTQMVRRRKQDIKITSESTITTNHK